jgi:hypothetical protein
MTEETPDFEPADAEEVRAAVALREALDRGAASPGLPERALETAALLRFAAGAGQLSPERRALMRANVLAESRVTGALRQGPRLRRWVVIGVPLLASAAAVALAIRGPLVADRSEQAANSGIPDSVPRSAASAVGARPSVELAERERADMRAEPRPGEQLRVSSGERLGRAVRLSRERLLAKLQDSRLEQAHALVDLARSPAQLEAAQTHLSALTSGALGVTSSESDTRLARQDIFCRLAEVALRLGQLQAALDWTRQGLDLDGSPSPFLAQLSQLQGQAREGLGDRAGAAQSYMQALRINEALLQENLEGP